MSRQRIQACGIGILIVMAMSSSAPRADESPSATDTVAIAKRVWAITEVVLAQHVEPPSRQEMLLAGMRGLDKAGRASPTPDLSRRVSEVVTEEQWAKLVRDMWPSADGERKMSVPELQEAVLQGLFQSIPGAARFIPTQDLKVLEQIEGNRYVGTGIQIRKDSKEQAAQIVFAFPGGPARRAGALTDDLILEVDGKNVQGERAVNRVVELLRGEEGTAVSMVVRRPGATERRTINMIRSIIPFETVVGHRRPAADAWTFQLDPKLPIAYVRITNLRSSTLHELRQIEQQLQADGCRALVLDLRFNADGQFRHTVLLADGLLDGGVMWQVRDGRNQVREYRADRECLFRNWPLAVLVNEYTRGEGAELLAAALQDNRRGPLVGEPTRGDGTVRSFVPLPDDLGALIFRTGVVESPARRRGAARPEAADSTAAAPRWSVVPEHLVTMDPKSRSALGEWFRAQEQFQPLQAGPAEPPEDPQLAKAVELLRSDLAKETSAEKSSPDATKPR